MPPATRAKSAAMEAPKLKPLSSWRASASFAAVSRNAKKAAVRPPRPKETTTKPITDPAVKATCKPLLSVPRAQATVVRTLASVATSMPTQPAKALNAAPAMKAAATRGPSPAPPPAWLVTGYRAKRTNKTPATINTMRPICPYSSRRKAIAPDLIWPAKTSSCVFATRFPVGCLSRPRHNWRVKRRHTPAAPRAGKATFWLLTSIAPSQGSLDGDGGRVSANERRVGS
mmetsp:Transcript_21037/g.52693  ORF Transcript_21037/g.52693 Transcript_21037/m.52693 type:complete len:229 (+) Transcript_21037:77-763(+)